MKPIGAILSGIAYSGKINQTAVEALIGLQEVLRRDLCMLGVEGDWAESVLSKAEKAFLEKASLCDSPIEQIMLACLSHMIVPGTKCFPPIIHDIQSGEPFPIHPVVIVPQFTIARYRLDFLLFIRLDERRLMYAIECDGADYHSSIEQRRNDAARDEYLEALGITTMRFGGQWIHRTGNKVVDELTGLFSGLARAA